MLRRDKLKTITAYNFLGKKVIRSIVSLVSLNGNELVIDLHYALHAKGKQFVIDDNFSKEDSKEKYTISVGDYIVEGICEETKKAGIIEAGGFIVDSVEIACLSFGTPTVIKATLSKMNSTKESDSEEDKDNESEEEPENEEPKTKEPEGEEPKEE